MLNMTSLAESFKKIGKKRRKANSSKAIIIPTSQHLDPALEVISLSPLIFVERWEGTVFADLSRSWKIYLFFQENEQVRCRV